jgi:hypothetical protein
MYSCVIGLPVERGSEVDCISGSFITDNFGFVGLEEREWTANELVVRAADRAHIDHFLVVLVVEQVLADHREGLVVLWMHLQTIAEILLGYYDRVPRMLCRPPL